MLKKRWFIILFSIIVSFLVLSLILWLLFRSWEQELDYRLDGLHPQVESASEKLIEQSAQRKITIRITQGFRSIEEQNRLYAQGRTTPGEIVTYAQGGESFHNYGLAVDFVVIDPKTGQPNWDNEFDGNQNGKSDWEEVAEVGKQLGFSWGGDWQGFKDYPHLEMTFGQSIWELNMHRSLQ